MQQIVPAPPARRRSITQGQRVGLACLFFLNALASRWVGGIHRFDWVPLSCLGVSWLTLSPRGVGESFQEYIRKPRNVFTCVLMIVGVLGYGRTAYLIYLKHFG